MKKWLLICLACLIFSSTGFTQQLTRVEYYFNTDPGQGNGTSIAFAAADSININADITLPSTLSPGINFLFIRVANNNGVWSHPEIYLININSASKQVAAGEYFWDSDPGVGLATPFSFSAGDSISSIQNIPVPSLSLGTHSLFVRTKNTDGAWSEPEKQDMNICTGYGPTSKFDYTVQGKTVVFSDSSLLSASSYWDFGDGQTDNKINPSHDFTNGGIYEVKLATHNVCGVDTLKRIVSIRGVQSVYPNYGPTHGGMIFQVAGFGFDSTTTVQLYRNGTTIPTGRTSFEDESTLRVKCINDTLATGMYDVITTTGIVADTLRNAITIQPVTPNALWFSIDGPEKVLFNRYNKFFIRYGNSGNNTVAGALVMIRLPGNTSVLTANKVDTTGSDPAIANLSPNLSGFLPITDSATNTSYNMGVFVIPYIEPGSENSIELEIKTPTLGNFNIELVTSQDGLYNIMNVMDVDQISTSRTDSLGCNEANWPPCFKCAMGIGDNFPGASCIVAAVKLYCSVRNAIDSLRPNPRGHTVKQKVNAIKAVIGVGMGVASAIAKCNPVGAAEQAVYSGLKGAVQTIAVIGGIGSNAIDMANTVQDCINCLKPKIKNIKVLAAFDPNIKIGPGGPKTEKYISGAEGSNYTITFENLPSATAPASEVSVNDTLDLSKLDALSFSFSGFGFGDSTYAFQCYDTSFVRDIDLRPAKNTIVRVSGKYEPLTGAVAFNFSSYDPATMKLTTAIDDGFLPPDTNGVSGQGYVSYLIKPKKELITGETINNVAKIIFDSNAAINTPVWHNTIDKQLPASHIAPTAVHVSDSTYLINIIGDDQHSGVWVYQIYVSVNDSAYRLIHITDSSAFYFKGNVSKIYKFYSVAIDSVYNIEAPPAGPDLVLAVVLPVTWLEFKAFKKDKFAKLEWSTASEQNSRGFEIQRSDDGIHFTAIGFINGAGNSSSTRNYSFIDSLPEKGVNYYRLKEVDFNGRGSLSVVRQIRFDEGAFFTIHPNPAKDKLVIDIPGHDISVIRVSDVAGRVLWQQEDINAARVEILLQSFTAGVYFVQLSDKNGKMSTRKFLKQ